MPAKEGRQDTSKTHRHEQETDARIADLEVLHAMYFDRGYIVDWSRIRDIKKRNAAARTGKMGIGKRWIRERVIGSSGIKTGE